MSQKATCSLLICAACDHILFNLGNTFVGSSQDIKELGQAKAVFAMAFAEICRTDTIFGMDILKRPSCCSDLLSLQVFI